MDEPDLQYPRLPSDPWDEIVVHFRENFGPEWWDGRYLPMVKLVEEIAASPLSAHLFGQRCPLYPLKPTGTGQLNLCRTRSLTMWHQMLAVRFVPEDDWFLFEYYEAAYSPKPWATCSPATEGFATLEWVLCKRLRWFRKSESRHER
jgi:hypothetical protein